MSITPGGWTSFDNPAASPLVNYMSTAGQPVSYGTNSTGGQASQVMQQVLFGKPPPGYTPNFGQTPPGASVQGGVDSNGMPLPSTADFAVAGMINNQSATPYSQPLPGYRLVADGMAMVPTQPAAAVRDPRYNGMPDEMYNNMIKHQQQRQAQIQRNLDNGLTGFDAYAIPETADIKSWDMWMAENPNGIQPPASIHLDNQPQPPIGMIGKGGGQPIAQPAPTPAPVVQPAPVAQPKQNSLTQALARTRTAGQGYVRPQARQVARNTQPRLSTAPIRTRTK